MKKIALTLILFASLFASNSYSNTNEIPNEKVFDNPKKEVTTVEAKKNKEHAEMNIKVNKFNIQELQGYDIGNGKTQYFILKDTENNSILNKLKNTSEYIVLETKEDLSKFLNTNRKNKSLIKKVNFEILEDNEQTMLTVDSNKEVYIAKLDVTPKIFKGSISEKNIEPLNVRAISMVNYQVRQIDSNRDLKSKEYEEYGNIWHPGKFDTHVTNAKMINIGTDEYFRTLIPQLWRGTYLYFDLSTENYKNRITKIFDMVGSRKSDIELSGIQTRYNLGKYNDRNSWRTCTLEVWYSYGYYATPIYATIKNPKIGFMYSIPNYNELKGFYATLNLETDVVHIDSNGGWNQRRVNLKEYIANSIPSNLTYNYTLDPTILNIEQNIDNTEQSRLSYRFKSRKDEIIIYNNSFSKLSNELGEIDLTDSVGNKFKFGYTQQDNEFAKPYIKILDFFDDTNFTFKVTQKVMIEGQDKTLENVQNGYKTDITLNLKYPESGVRILDITELKKGDTEIFNLNGRNIQGEPINFSDCEVIKIGKVGDQSSFRGQTYKDSNLSIGYDKTTNILTVEKLLQGQEEGIDIFIKGYDNSGLLKKIQKIRLFNLNYRGEELKYSAVVDPRYINALSKASNKKINYAGQIDGIYDYSNFFKVETNTNLNKARIVNDILEINNKTTFITEKDTFEYEKYKFKSNVNIDNFLKTAYLDDHTLAFSDSVRLDVLLNDQKRHYFDLTLRRGENILDNITGSGVLDTTNAIVGQELIFSQDTNVSDIVALIPVEGQQIKIQNSGDFINPYHSEDKNKVIANKISVNGKMMDDLNYNDKYFGISIDLKTGYLKVNKKTNAIVNEGIYNIDYYYNEYKLGSYKLTIINKNSNLTIEGLDSINFGKLIRGKKVSRVEYFKVNNHSMRNLTINVKDSELINSENSSIKIPLSSEVSVHQHNNEISGALKVIANPDNNQNVGNYIGEVVLEITIE